MPPPPLRDCSVCGALTDCASGKCASCSSKTKPPAKVEMKQTTICGLADPGQPASEADIFITCGLANSATTSFKRVPLNQVQKFLQENKECYEITMPHDSAMNRVLNRVYVDLDGELDFDMSEQTFQAESKKIESALKALATSEGFSLMESSKWKSADEKGVSSNKLSYRLTYPKLGGTKASIKFHITKHILPMLVKCLAGIIPVKSILKKTKAMGDVTGSLIVDMSVYDFKRKMRMLGQSKPVQKRPNKVVIGDWKDTLITYIPPDCKMLPEPQSVLKLSEVPLVAPVQEEDEASVVVTMTTDPTEDDLAIKQLVADVLENIGQHRWDYYPDWLRIAFICYNEGFTLPEFIELSKKSKHFKAETSPKWISQKWKNFKRSNLTQALLWKWLSEDDIEAYVELSEQRKDFWRLVKNANHAETARFFYNLKPDAYLFNERLGWFMLLPNNIWKHYDNKPNGLLPDIWSSFKKIIKEHENTVNMEETDEEKAKFEKAKLTAIRKFESAIGNKTFCDGVIAFLPCMYNDDELDKKMDESRHLIAFNDMVYDLEKSQARVVLPDDFVSLNTGYAFPSVRFPQAREELVDTLRSIFESEMEIEASDDFSETTSYCLKTIASCLNGTKKYEKFYVWTGTGGNGKGLISELVKRAFGDYYHSIPHSCLTKTSDKKDAPNPPMAKSKGKRFVQASEPEAEDKLQAGVVKELSGGDDITARDMYRTTITFRPQFGLFLQTNAIPKLNRADGGIQRRMEVLPFPFNFKENPTEPHHKQINHDLKDKIIKSPEWRDEMFHLLLEAYQSIQKDGLIAPTGVKEASAEYMDENNPIKNWLEQNYDCSKDPQNRQFQIGSQALLHAYEGDTNHKISPDKFKTSMMLCGVTLKKESHPYTYMVDGQEQSGRAGRYWCGLERRDREFGE